MEVGIIERVVADQKDEIGTKLKNENIIEREFMREISTYSRQAGLTVLSGVRRCGKSVTSLLLSKSSYGYVNFDDPSLDGLKAGDLIYVKEAIASVYGDPETIILDEVQNVKGWELFASRLRETKQVIVTGSNAGLLSNELGTRLTGRYVKFEVMPFSFREFLEYRSMKADIRTTAGIASVKKEFGIYMRLGGFPESYKFGVRYLSQIYEDILTKDIEKRYNIRYKATFRDFARYVISNSTNRISYNNIRKNFDISSTHTVKNYIRYMKDAYLIFIVNSYSARLKEQERSQKKIYCVDNGILDALGFKIIDNKSKLMENLVALALFREKFYYEPTLEIYYWHDQLQREVDFVTKKGERVAELIQVTYDLNEGNEKRETRSLLGASKAIRCKNLTIITWDIEKTLTRGRKKIKCIPIWKWILESR